MTTTVNSTARQAETIRDARVVHKKIVFILYICALNYKLGHDLIDRKLRIDGGGKY